MQTLNTNEIINKYYFWHHSLLDDIVNSRPFSFYELNYLSARLTLKTTQIDYLIGLVQAVSISTNKTVGVYAGRYSSVDVPELVAEIKKGLNKVGLLDGVHYKFRWGKSRPIFLFSNGSFIKCYGAKRSNENVVNLKGLSDMQCDYAIDWREEANEYSKQDEQAVTFAIRGYKISYIKIRSANPDFDNQEFVKYCVSYLNHDRNKLKNDKYQLATFKEIINDVDGQKKEIIKLFFYATYKINPYLTTEQINAFEELQTTDPLKYDSWALGIPSTIGENVFAYYKDRVKPFPNFRPVRFVSGIDLGHADTPVGHPTVVEFVGINEKGKMLPLTEYFHSNATGIHKDTFMKSKDIIDFYHSLAYKYPLIKNGHTAFVDYGSSGQMFIDVLNQEAHKQGLKWLRFERVEKSIWLVKDRTEALKIMINKYMFWLDKSLTPNLWDSIFNLRWKKAPSSDQTKYEPVLVDRDDDAFDALCYAIMQEMYKVIHDNTNPLLLSKSLQKRILTDKADTYKW